MKYLEVKSCLPTLKSMYNASSFVLSTGIIVKFDFSFPYQYFLKKYSKIFKTLINSSKKVCVLFYRPKKKSDFNLEISNKFKA